MHNRLGLTLVLVYFGHCIAAVAYGATIDDPEGQAVWLSAPLWLTPPWLLQLIPTVSGPKSYAQWHLQILVQFPVAFSFTSVSLYACGALLQLIWAVGPRFAAAVGGLLGLFVGGLWFLITHTHNPLWLSLAPLGGLVGFYAKRRFP